MSEHVNILSNTVYPFLREREMVKSKAEFSTVWLERTGRYASVTAYAPASVKVLKTLLPKLQARGLYDLAATVQKQILA